MLVVLAVLGVVRKIFFLKSQSITCCVKGNKFIFLGVPHNVETLCPENSRPKISKRMKHIKLCILLDKVEALISSSTLSTVLFVKNNIHGIKRPQLQTECPSVY